MPMRRRRTRKEEAEIVDLHDIAIFATAKLLLEVVSAGTTQLS